MQLNIRTFAVFATLFTVVTLDSAPAEEMAMQQRSSTIENLEKRTLFSVGGSYAVPATPSVTVNEDASWRFKFAPSGTPQATNFDDSSWSTVNLPYTWNAVDGASTNYAQGTGWYRKTITLPSTVAGKKLYLHFEGGSIATSLYIDGAQIDLNPATAAVDSHQGGFQAFDFDVTAALNAAIPAGKTGHVVAVAVSNSSNANVAPGNSGDYSKEGGLYRDVSLIAVNPTHAALSQIISHSGLSGIDTKSQISSPAVQFSNSTVVIGAASTTISVKTTLDNLQAARSVAITSYLVDESGVIRAQMYTTQALAVSQTGATIAQTANVNNPHLWDGRIDPYLYTLYVEVHDAVSYRLLDVQKQQVGIRSFQINPQPNPNDANPNNRVAFLLNGHAYRVVGVNMHQDSGAMNANGDPVGWARTDAQIRADIDLLADMGGTAIRTSHYQDNQAFYDYCDQLGILVYTESPINGLATAGDAFLSNAEDQYTELVRQTVNHPSVFAWGFGNETSDSTQLRTIFKQFNSIAHAYDSSRKTGFATYGGSQSSSTNADGVSDIKGTHLYDYWYGQVNNPGQTLAAYPTQPLGVTEYGGGASAYQYANSFSLPVSGEPGGVTTHYHPANQQTRLEEIQYTDLTSLGYLWGQFTWQMFDHASSGKNEGEQGGINDKGLVTRDRVPKDSYYFYKSALNDPSRAWANQRVLYVSDRFWTSRNSPATQVTVFSNIGAPTLVLNGVSLGAMSALTATSGSASASPGSTVTLPGTYVMNVTLTTGTNTLQAAATYADGETYKDSAVWTYRSSVSGTPVTKIDFLASGQTPATGYSADNGANYASRNGQTYGWRTTSGTLASFGSGSATNPAANGFTLNYSPIYRTSSVWEYAVPNGTYDVQIGAGQSGASDGVNLFTLEGKTAAIDSNGNNAQDTFYSRVTVTDGNLTLAAAPGAYNTRIDYLTINSVTDTVPPDVASVSINGGDLQRSQINALSITFTKPVNLQTGAILLALRGVSTYAVTPTNPSGDGMTYSLSLSDGTSLTTLPDGIYDLSVDAAKVASAIGAISMASPYTATFHHLFGDVNGDRRVDKGDNLYLNFAQGSSTDAINYKSFLDFNSDGSINALDTLRFKKNIGRSVTY